MYYFSWPRFGFELLYRYSSKKTRNVTYLTKEKAPLHKKEKTKVEYLANVKCLKFIKQVNVGRRSNIL